MDQNTSLDNCKLPAHVKVKHIPKKFYSKYVYKIVLQIDKTQLKEDGRFRSWRSSYATFTNRLSLLNDLIRLVKSKITDDDYRFRSESLTVSYFTNSENDIVSVMNFLGHRVIEFYRPVSVAHVDLLDEHTKVVVRSSLFEKKYRFKVYLKPSWVDREARFKETKDWLESSATEFGLNNSLQNFFYTNKSPRGMGYTVAVYFNDPQDLMMFQLRFNEKIQKIEEAVLVSDL
jgi:hypothetical protein